MSANPMITLTVAFAPGSCQLALAGAGMAPIRFGFTATDGDAASLAPATTPDGVVLLDGPAFAALPVAMRARRALHVAGPISRRALRDLTEYAATWASFTSRTDTLAAVEVSADAVLDLAAPPLGETALLAWDGGLAAAAMLVRHHQRHVTGALRPAGLVHVAGLATPEHDQAVVEAIAPAAAEGIALIRLTTDAVSAGAFDRTCGRLPLATAALHLAGGPHRIGLVARNWTYPALLGLYRPQPHAPDMLSGDLFSVATDGGGLSPADQAGLAARMPAIAAAIRPRRPRDADLAALGFAATGGEPPAAVRRRSPLAAAFRLDLGDRVGAAAAAMIGAGSSRGAAMSVLRARLAVAQAGKSIGEYGRWAGAMLGLREPWPR